MLAGKMEANKSSQHVNEIYKRVFSSMHVIETSGYKCDPRIEMHQISLMFSRILGHSCKKGFLNEKTFDELLMDIEPTS